MRARLALVLALAGGGCVSAPCFTPPPTSTQVQKDIMLKAAATITAIPVTPSLETDFKAQVNQTYAALDNDDATYFMAASLALCFADKGKWGRDVASRILRDLEIQWLAKTGKASADDHPQAVQIQAIKASAGVPSK